MNTLSDCKGQVLSGKKFNELYRDYKFYKIIQPYLSSYGFKYQYGLNVDTKKFNPSGECSVGGIYFTDEDNIDAFQCNGEVIVDVSIPDNAQVYIERNKYKADRVILTNFRDYKYPFKSRWKNLFNPELLISGILLVGFSVFMSITSKK